MSPTTALATAVALATTPTTIVTQTATVAVQYPPKTETLDTTITEIQMATISLRNSATVTTVPISTATILGVTNRNLMKN